MPKTGQKCLSWKNEYAALAWALFDKPVYREPTTLLAAMARFSDKADRLTLQQVHAWCTLPTRLQQFVTKGTTASGEPFYRWTNAVVQPPMPRPTPITSQEIAAPVGGLLRKNPDPKGRNWCGPLAMTALTGLGYQQCEQLIQNLRDDKPVARARYRRAKGGGVGAVFHTEIDTCLQLLGYRAVRTWTPDLARTAYGLSCRWERLTLKQWYQKHGRDWATHDQPILVLITGHYVTLYRGRVYDIRHPEGSPITAKAYAKARVRKVLMYEKRGEQMTANPN